MRLRILSDLHLEFGDWVPPEVPAEVVILAGDINKGARAAPWIERHFPAVPVIYVAGNHEFYGGNVQDVLQDLRTLTQPTQLNFLENRSVEIGDVVFLGCTLWTDFNLQGDPPMAAGFAAAGMNDYRLIRVLPEHRRLKGRDTAGYHADSRRWLEGEFKRFQGRRIVVVTHHAPSIESLDPVFGADLLGAAYASRLEDMIEAASPLLWIHGHTHRSVDYTVGKTRVLANQRGYPDQGGTGFRPELVVEL